MTEHEYKYGLKQIEYRYEKEKNAHKKLYADYQRIFSVGDIIQNNLCIIRVDKFKWSNNFGGDFPCPVYIGMELTKKLQPKKTGSIETTIYGNIGVKKIQ